MKRGPRSNGQPGATASLSTGRIVAGSTYCPPARNAGRTDPAHSKPRGNTNPTGAGEPLARRNPTTTTKAPGSCGHGFGAETPRYRRGRKGWIPTETAAKGSSAVAFAPPSEDDNDLYERNITTGRPPPGTRCYTRNILSM